MSIQQSNQIARLCETIERVAEPSIRSQPSILASKTLVTFPIFSGEEHEDVHKFIDNYRHVARLSEW